ncbi:hypothetical protein E5D57_000887 [Metarhizium anisopliae]|nr:hypothetical protein E5D57_000887 [Metarhizium anisopliae]
MEVGHLLTDPGTQILPSTTALMMVPPEDEELAVAISDMANAGAFIAETRLKATDDQEAINIIINNTTTCKINKETKARRNLHRRPDSPFPHRLLPDNPLLVPPSHNLQGNPVLPS